ncbi:hypothetical protein BDA99DRAFT_555076 [Phascolomyces articulosus]|uniref:Uncharacterized protein n=1 Tax=Phascolomyces articulosus TaxID=60185 RepID=A0AAD5KX93_9FUNG|nr:hypothetical protein BDA99DRAFT_555076 [Phascolomyces articulosus]
MVRGISFQAFFPVSVLLSVMLNSYLVSADGVYVEPLCAHPSVRCETYSATTDNCCPGFFCRPMKGVDHCAPKPVRPMPIDPQLSDNPSVFPPGDVYAPVIDHRYYYC